MKLQVKMVFNWSSVTLLPIAYLTNGNADKQNHAPKSLDNWVLIERDVAVKEIHGVDKASDMYRRKLGFHG